MKTNSLKYVFVEDVNLSGLATHEYHENRATMNYKDSTVSDSATETSSAVVCEFYSCLTQSVGTFILVTDTDISVVLRKLSPPIRMLLEQYGIICLADSCSVLAFSSASGLTECKLN